MLKDVTHKGNGNSAKKTDREIAEIFGISKTTANQIRKIYAIDGIYTALNRRTRINAPILSKITDDFKAQVNATALSSAPKGRAR